MGNIIKYEGDELTKEIKGIYEERLFGKDRNIGVGTEGDSMINLLIFKVLQCFDVLNDEVLVVTNDAEAIAHYKKIGLCKAYLVKDDIGLVENDSEEIQKYL